MDIEAFKSYLGSQETIPGQAIEEAMRSDDLVVLGVLWEIAASHWDRIVPQVDLVECNRAIARYFLLCIENDPQPQDFVCSSYEAARELVPFFHYWKDEEVELCDLIPETLDKLREVYLRVDERKRFFIETAFLEHLVEDLTFLPYLKNWEEDPRTASVIANAIKGWYGPNYGRSD